MDRIKLETKRVSIKFLGVKAPDDIDFEVTTGGIRAAVGANGVGKSTSTRMLIGANSSYTGEAFLNDKKVEIRTPVDVEKLGTQIVCQEADTVSYPTLSVVESIVQNDMATGKSGYIINWNKTYKQGRTALDRLHISRNQMDEHRLIQNLSLAQKQVVLTAKAIRSECNFLVLGRPIAPSSNMKTEELSRIVQHLHKIEDIATLPISHQLNEILKICENYTVMRNDKIVDAMPVTKQTTTRGVAEKMLGRAPEEDFPEETCEAGETLSEILYLSGTRGEVKDVSIQVESGEVVRTAGLVGAGESELCRTLFGAFKMTDGKIMLKGRELRIANPLGAVKNYMALMPEERRKEGVLVHGNVSPNLSTVCFF